MVRHEAVQESVPENCKNMLLVLGAAGILTPQWRVRGCLACCWDALLRGGSSGMQLSKLS